MITKKKVNEIVQLLSFLYMVFSRIDSCVSWSVRDTTIRRILTRCHSEQKNNCEIIESRRGFLSTAIGGVGSGIITITSTSSSIGGRNNVAFAVDDNAIQPVEVTLTGDAKKLFNEGRAYETQGNMAAAQRLYTKVTKIAPRFVYGYSNLGNTQTVFGDLNDADVSYTTAINLCIENNMEYENGLTTKRCNDLYVLYLNRGSIRLNNNMLSDALLDLQQSVTLRGRPDSIVLQNLARAKELNGLYEQADRDYTVAISMTANEVNPFWLRSALVKYQLGDYQGGYDLFKRVENRFPEAPEVRAAYACFLYKYKNDITSAQQKFLEIPDRQRIKYSDYTYLTKTITWPPAMIDTINKITTAVGDKNNNNAITQMEAS